MRQPKLLLLFLFAVLKDSPAQKIILDFMYKGKNIYVQNPMKVNENGFCTQEVFVNGKSIPFAQSSAYEIKLDSLKYRIGDSLHIEIRHSENCTPKIINEVINAAGTFKILKIYCDEHGMLRWITEGELGKLMYQVQQYRWDKWITVGEIEGKGDEFENAYSVQVQFHTGENKFRVCQTYPSGKMNLSKTLIVPANRGKNGDTWQEPVTYSMNSDSCLLLFSRNTMYEIYDNYGNISLKGNSSQIELSTLKPGKYHLNFDNSSNEIKVNCMVDKKKRKK